MNHDEAEAAALADHYAQPAARKPYLPTDRDVYREGLLKGARTHDPNR